MKMRHILMSTLALSLLALGINAGTTHASSTSYSHPYNALNSYIKLGHFNMVNNHNYSVSANYDLNQDTNPNRYLHTIGGNWKDSYKPYAILQDNPGEYNPQSVVIKPNGTTFISYGLDNDRTQLVRYDNINNTETDDDGNAELANPHYGPVFKGAHGQSMAWNPKTNQLWLQYNTGGATDNVRMLLINQKTLKPTHQLKFGFNPYPFGDVLTFDKNGNAYTATDTFSNPSHIGAPVGSLKLYKGTITTKSAHFHMIQGLRHTPGAIMQNLAYNPANNRIYALADGNYISFPASQRITPGNVHSTKLNSHYEPEDLAFYHGHTYLMLHYPSQLMINTNNDYARHASHAKKNRARRHSKRTIRKSRVHVNKRHGKRTNRKSVRHMNKHAVRRHGRRNRK